MVQQNLISGLQLTGLLFPCVTFPPGWYHGCYVIASVDIAVWRDTCSNMVFTPG